MEHPGPESAQSIAALIVAFNDASTTRAAVESALVSGVSDVLVWDNSTDPAARSEVQELSSLEHVTVLSDATNHGFGGGNNRAALAASGDLLLLLNPDCEVTPEVVASLRQVLARGNVGVVAPMMRYPDGRYGIAGGGRPSLAKELLAATNVDDVFPSWVRTAALRVLAILARVLRRPSVGSSLAAGGPVNLAWVSGFCMMLPRSVFESVGGFDESFFLYFEDVDLCERIAATGFDVVLDRRVSALHHESLSTSAVGKSAHYWAGLRTYYSRRGMRIRAWVVSLFVKGGRA